MGAAGGSPGPTQPGPWHSRCLLPGACERDRGPGSGPGDGGGAARAASRHDCVHALRPEPAAEPGHLLHPPAAHQPGGQAPAGVFRQGGGRGRGWHVAPPRTPEPGLHTCVPRSAVLSEGLLDVMPCLGAETLRGTVPQALTRLRPTVWQTTSKIIHSFFPRTTEGLLCAWCCPQHWGPISDPHKDVPWTQMCVCRPNRFSEPGSTEPQVAMDFRKEADGGRDG